MDTLAFFTQRNWEWQVKSLRHMQQVIHKYHPVSQPLLDESAHEWNTSVRNINWSEYLESFCVGTKCFVLNEELSDLNIAKQRMSR